MGSSQCVNGQQEVLGPNFLILLFFILDFFELGVLVAVDHCWLVFKYPP